MPEPIVTASELTKVYVTDDVETRALWNIDLVIEQGEFVAITGPSGCGKSTLLSVLGLMDMPTSGRLVLGGREAARLSLWQRARLRNELIGFVFQSFHLVGNLSTLDNVALPLSYAGVARSQRREMAAQALTRVDMQHRLHHFPAQLSGGQQQRVAVARAIVTQPQLILADEPTGNLDSENGSQIMQLLSEEHEQKGTTICLVTHDLPHAEFAQRRIHLLDGHVVPNSELSHDSGSDSEVAP